MDIDNQKLSIVESDAKSAESEETEKEDSGMEESMGTSSSPHSENEELQKEEEEDHDSDIDEDFCVRKHQKQSRVIVDDDDDDDNSNDIQADNTLEPSSLAEASFNEDDDVCDIQDESEEEDSIIIKRKKKTSLNSSESSPEKSNAFSRKHLFQTINSDLSDANDSNSETNSPLKDKNSFEDCDEDDDGGGGGDDDEGIDTQSLSNKLKALLKMGASKKPRKSKARLSKTIAEEKLELHSETQRLIRESKVQIPYHQPESKPLNDFLNRALRKQQQYQALKVYSKDERKKVEFVQDTIINDSLLFKKASPLESANQNTPKDNSSQSKDSVVASLKSQPLVSSSESADCEHPIINGDSAVSREDLPLTENSSLAPETQVSEIHSVAEDCQNDSDEELPDLVISEEPASCQVDSTEDVPAAVVPELFETVSEDPVADKCPEHLRETEMDMERDCSWVVDENGLLKTDDPVMDELIASDLNGSGLKVNKDPPPPPLSVRVGGKEESEMKTNSEEHKKAPAPPKLSMKELLSPKLKSLKPRLSGSRDELIILDENNPEEVVKNPGLDRLMERLLQHTNVKKEHNEGQNVNIKIIQKKEQSGTNKEELCLNTVSYQMEKSEELTFKSDTPGAKLLLLKDKLQEQMRVKRESAREKRCEIFKLNNEDGFEDEDEAELTEGSDTDVSEDNNKGDDDEEDEEEELVENDLGEDYGKEKRSRNDFVDEEAEEESEDQQEQDDDDDDDDDNGDDNNNEELEKDPKDSGDQPNDENRVEDVLFDFNENSDSDSIIPESQNRPKIKKIIKNLVFSDDESQNGSIQSGEDKNDESSNKDRFHKTDFSGTFSRATTQIEPKTPSSLPFSVEPLQMPAEDSQDLYKSSNDFQSPELISPNLQFPSLHSQASPMFDEQGFLRVKTLTKTVNEPKISALNELCDNNDEDSEDILGLCSGKFSTSQDDRVKSCRTLFSDSQTNSFPTSGFFPFSSQLKKDEKKRNINNNNFAEEESEDFPSLKLVSEDEDDEDDDNNNEKLHQNDSDNDKSDSDQEGGSEKEEDEEEEEDHLQKSFPKFRMKSSGKIRREFVDEEAELSGSEFESDENDNLDDEFDIMDDEEGDQDVNLTEDQLRSQVGRVHLKNMIDDDKREVMRLQEMYLPDGDLFSEGHGRTRRFRWKNIDENSQEDMFKTESDTEEKDEEEPDELKWRIERYEREKWIHEQEIHDKKQEEESPFLKFGREFLKKQGSSIQNPSKKLSSNFHESPKQINKIKNLKKGSFLTRSRDSLAKIAEMTKPVSNQTVTNKTNGRNFVFSVVTPTETETDTPVPKTGLNIKSLLNVNFPKPQKKTKSENPSSQPAKKRKVEQVRRTLSEGSVFRHIDKSYT